MATKPTPRRKAIVPVTRELILKAKDDDPPVAVYSQDGRLLGICKPSDVTPVADPAGSAAAPAAKKQPTQTQRTEAAAGETPDMSDLTKARATALGMKRKLYGGSMLASEQDQAARDLSQASQTVLKAILAQGPRRVG